MSLYRREDARTRHVAGIGIFHRAHHSWSCNTTRRNAFYTWRLLLSSCQSRVVPESAASLVLRAGDVVTAVAGVEIRQWSLDNIQRLLETQGRVNIKIRRRAEATPEPQLYDGGALRGNSQPKAVSCYATVEGDIEEVHALECTQAALGSDLPTFATAGAEFAFPLMVAQPLEHCADDPSLNASGHALLVSRYSCAQKSSRMPR